MLRECWKTLVFALGALCIVTGVSVVLLARAYLRLKVRVAFAREQVQVFEAIRAGAADADLADTLDELEYVVSYYPSGTKQVEGSALDAIVELSRRRAIQDIIAILRKKTGADFGDDAVQWLKRRQFIQARQATESN